MIIVPGAYDAYSQVPPAETPCNILEGAPRGLCHAYCEAMDCDSEEPRANPKACGRIFDKLVEYTGEAPPCEEEVCAEEIIETCGGETVFCNGELVCSYVIGRGGDCELNDCPAE